MLFGHVKTPKTYLINEHVTFFCTIFPSAFFVLHFFCADLSISTTVCSSLNFLFSYFQCVLHRQTIFIPFTVFYWDENTQKPPRLPSPALNFHHRHEIFRYFLWRKFLVEANDDTTILPHWMCFYRSLSNLYARKHAFASVNKRIIKPNWYKV